MDPDCDCASCRKKRRGIQRRMEVLVRRCCNQSVKEIASDMGLATSTVETHWYDACRQLIVNGIIERADLAEVIHWAWEWKVIPYYLRRGDLWA